MDNKELIMIEERLAEELEEREEFGKHCFWNF